MPSQTDPTTLLQRDVVDTNGDKVGPIGQIYLDDATHAAEWVTIQTGLFGTKESFVPLQGAEMEDDDLKVPYDKDKIKEAPALDGEEHLSAEREVELYRYYNMPYPEGGSPEGGEESGAFQARTEHFPVRPRLSKFAATDHQVAEAHRARIKRGSGL